MKTKTALIILALLLIQTVPLPSSNVDIFSQREIIELYNRKKYSILLEKTISLLSGTSGRLTPTEEAFLQYYTGSAYIKQGNYTAGTGYFRELEQKHPKSEFLKFVFLQRAELDKSDYFKWEAWLLKIFNNYPKSKEAVNAGIKLSKSYLKLKNHTKAVRILETIVNLWQMEEQDRESIILLALAYSGIRDYIEAVDYVRKAADLIQPVIDRNQQYLFEAGNIYYNTQNFKEAIASHQRFLNIYTKSPKLPEAAIQMADAYERTGNRYMAAIYLITVIRQKRGEKKNYTMLLNLARILMNLDAGDYRKIARRYPLESKITPMLKEVRDKSPEFNERREAVLLLGTSLKKEDRKKELFDIYFDFLRQKRDKYLEGIFKKTLNSYINELVAKKNYNGIAQVWSKLKTRKSLLSGDNLLSVAEMFYQLNLLKNTEDIIKHIKKYTMYRKLYQKADILLIRTAFKKNDYAGTLNLLNRFKAVPKNRQKEFLYYKLISLEEEKKDKLLAAELDKLKTEVPKDNYSYRILMLKSRSLELKNRYSEALAVLNTAIKYKSAREKDYLVKKADILYGTGKLDESLTLYNRAAKVIKDNPDWILFQKINIMKQMQKNQETAVLKQEMEKKYPDSYWLKQLNINDGQ